MNRLRYPSIIAACLLLLACAGTSPPVRHLQLSAGDTGAANSDSPVVVLDAVALPDYLLRDELLFREDTYSLRYDAFQRWAEPLDLGIQRVIGERLGRKLNTRQLVRFPDVTRAPADWHLRIEVRHFEYRAGEVILEADGRWTNPGDPSAGSRVVEFIDATAVASNDGSAIAAALSKLLWRFCDTLAESLNPKNDLDTPREG